MKFSHLTLAIAAPLLVAGTSMAQDLSLFEAGTTQAAVQNTPTADSLFTQQAMGTSTVDALMDGTYESATLSPVNLGTGGGTSTSTSSVTDGTNTTTVETSNSLLTLSNSATNALNQFASDDLIVDIQAGQTVLAPVSAQQSYVTAATNATINLPDMATVTTGVAVSNSALGAGNVISLGSNVLVAD